MVRDAPEPPPQAASIRPDSSPLVITKSFFTRLLPKASNARRYPKSIFVIIQFRGWAPELVSRLVRT